MASRDLHNDIKLTLALAPQAITSDTTTTGATIDTQGFASVEFAIASGVLTDGTYTPAIYESDDSGMSGETAVTAAGDLLGTIAGVTYTAGAPDSTVKKIGYRGSKRYVRLKIASTGTTSGGLMGAVAALGNARNAPVA